MKFIQSVCIILGAVISAINSLPIPHNNNNNNHNHNQIKIDLDPAIVVTRPTHPPASILYDINGDIDGVLRNPEVNLAIVPPAPPPAPPGPIIFNTNDLDTDGLLFHINPSIKSEIIPVPPPPAPPASILYEPLESGPIIMSP